MKLIIRLVLTALVLALSVAATAGSASAAPLEGSAILGLHTVRTGETLYCIGRAYSVQPWAIAAQNGIGQASKLYVGQVLAIPDAPWINRPAGPTCARQFDPGTPPPPPPDCQVTYTVTYGDTLLRIARRFNVNVYTLAARNGIYDLNRIFVGQVLCIPGSGKPAPDIVIVLPTDVQYVLALSNVNMRTGPGLEFAVIGKVYAGQIAGVTGVSGNGQWWRVICPDNTVGNCWVSADPSLTQPTTPPGW
ncbi:MAG TPA: LysM peptidoglycan-binding domain-containing protein [Anaerolineae bacterium]|nr:LysM peptidoglycan-binding domain-containing protein [Anaerolineae bacterium]